MSLLSSLSVKVNAKMIKVVIETTGAAPVSAVGAHHNNLELCITVLGRDERRGIRSLLFSHGDPGSVLLVICDHNLRRR